MKLCAIAAFIGVALVSQGAFAHGPTHDRGASPASSLIPGHFEAGMTGKVIAE